MHRRRLPRRRSRLRAWLCLAAVLALLCCGVKAADWRLRAQLHTLAAMRAFALQEASLNSAVLSAIESGSYEALVQIVQDDAGHITSIRTDTMRINLLKARISAAAEAALAEGEQIVSIPLGSLTGLDLLAGAGPSLRVKVRMSGYASAEIESAFTGAGVNQTLHRLTVHVAAHAALSMPHNTQQKDLSYDVCIAETVIVGTVPYAFAAGSNGE